MTRNAPPSPEHREWTAAQVEAHAEKALAAALAYFRIPDHWAVCLMFSGLQPESMAEIGMDHTYLRANILLDVEKARVAPRTLWDSIGHEVAHLAIAPFDQLWEALPDKVQGKQQGAYVRAMENTVVQLTRMFLRDVPDPAFTEGA